MMRSRNNTITYTIVVPLIMVLLLSACRKSDYEVANGSVTIRDLGEGTGTVTWTKDKSYILEGFVFVNDGQVLTIESGTVIRAKTGQGSAASALIVARGGKIIARGTSGEPIIFTVEDDDLEGSVPVDAQGLWGGLIILGRAPLNLSNGEAHIEGIPLTEPRGVYGGQFPDDDSGILEYISIRHAGTNIGEGNEINGLTLGAVGRNTTVNHVEVISCSDDGFEFFGGTVNCKYLLASFCGDDAFDFDLGYQGKGQFWLAIQDPGEGDKIVECNGGSDPVTGQPYTLPQLYNATFIGRGPGAGKKMIEFSLNGGGTFANSIMVLQDKGVFTEYVEGSQDSYKQFETGNLNVINNVFFNVGNQMPEGIFKVFAAEGTDVSQQNEMFASYFTDTENKVADPGITRDNDRYVLIPDDNVFDMLAPYPDPWFDEVSYKGAFYTYSWISGWTLLYEAGYILD
ncbi:MAG: hypothetical protein V2I47_03090 [Bacteroidales bacterium]|nr:hypothetical protein [Bacteroidales bacterium]